RASAFALRGRRGSTERAKKRTGLSDGNHIALSEHSARTVSRSTFMIDDLYAVYTKDLIDEVNQLRLRRRLGPLAQEAFRAEPTQKQQSGMDQLLAELLQSKKASSHEIPNATSISQWVTPQCHSSL